MQRRTTWVLIPGMILLAVITYAGRQWVFESPSPARAASVEDGPAFRVGDVAPDFTLPDAKGRPRRLSELVKRDTLLILVCACAACRELEIHAGVLMKRMGARAPAVLSVTTMPVEQEAAWLRDTGLPQTLLYESKGGAIMQQYAGNPCPRVYRLGPDRRVVWTSPSLKETRYIQTIVNALAVNLGFPPELHVPGEPEPAAPAPPPG